MEELREGRRVLPVGVIFVDHRLSIAPDFPRLPLIEGIGRGDDQRAIGLQVSAHVAEEQAGVFQVLDQLAGDDRVELPAQVHGFDVVTLRAIAHLPEHFDAGRIDVDAEGVFVYFDNALEQHVGFVIDALVGGVLGRTGIDAPEVEDVAGFDVGGDDVEAVGDGFGEHDVVLGDCTEESSREHARRPCHKDWFGGRPGGRFEPTERLRSCWFSLPANRHERRRG